MYLITSPTVFIFSASSSGMSRSNSSSIVMTSSTMSRLSAPRSSMKEAVSETFSGSTASWSQMIFRTLSSTDADIEWSPVYSIQNFSHVQAAVNTDDLSGHVTAGWGRQECHDARNILGRANITQRDAAQNGLFLRFRQAPCHVGRDITRRDNIAADLPASELFRDALREADQPCFG